MARVWLFRTKILSSRPLSLSAPMRPQIENILAAARTLCLSVYNKLCLAPLPFSPPASNRFTTPEPRTLDSTLCLLRSHGSKVHGALDRVVHLQLVGQIDLFHREREGRVGAADLYRRAASTGRQQRCVSERVFRRAARRHTRRRTGSEQQAARSTDRRSGSEREWHCPKRPR